MSDINCILFHLLLERDFSLPSFLTFGSNASYCNTVSDVPEECFYIETLNDNFKEDDEYFKLLLDSEDDQVCFCQDFALFSILEDENDGRPSLAMSMCR